MVLKKLAIMLIVAMLLTSALALAEVGKGDRGEEVRYLQWLLQRAGWLNDRPDGVFGGRTEQAVMDCQASLGLEATGIADDDLMQRLDRERVRKDKQEYGADYYEPYPGSYVPPYDTNYAAPFHCQTTALGSLVSRDFCQRHGAILDQEYRLTVGGDASGLAEAAALWLGDIDEMFSEWAESDSGANREQIKAARNAWSAYFTAHHDAARAALGDGADCERQQLLMLKHFAASLCEIRSGEMPAPVNKESIVRAVSLEPEEPGVTAEKAARCELWSINRATEFFTCCAKHDNLTKYEYKWSKRGTEEFYPKLDYLADKWNARVNALYKKWKSQCDGEAAKAVKKAKKAFKEALALQEALAAGDDAAAVARLRICQFESARLCELVNGEAA